MSLHKYQGTIWVETITIHGCSEDTFDEEQIEDHYMLCQIGPGKFKFIALELDKGNRLCDKILTSLEDIKRFHPNHRATNKKINIL